MTAAYDELLAKIHDVTIIETIAGVIGWDLETYMPPRGYPQRGEQQAFLSKIRHRILSSDNLGKLLRKVEQKTTHGKLDQVQKRNVHLIRKQYDMATRIPEELITALTKQRTITNGAWKRAKTAKDWKIFEPELSKLVDLIKQRAAILMEVKGTSSPYDALVDQFEPNMRSEKIARVFTKLRKQLVPLVDSSVAACNKLDFSFLQRPVPIETQRLVATDLAAFAKYDTTSKEAGGRIDEVTHPFSTGYYDDVRITTRYFEDNFTSGFYGILHESGHALYTQGHPEEWKWQPVGDASSFGIHESQSRFVENNVGRSPEFWEYYLPRLNKHTGNTFKDISVEQMVQAVNRVERSKIRVEADEITYILHIIIRFEIENDLFLEKINFADLPSIWNEKYEKYLGLEIENDSEGVMQDTHWAIAYFGYFPSYSLGNIYSGQFLEFLEKDLPDWKTQIGRGDFGPTRQWMLEKVHRMGDLYDPEDLVRQVTGEGLNAQPFVNYLESKYKQIFNL